MFKFFWERALVTAGKTTVRHQEELSNSQVWHLGKLISEEPVALSPLTLCVYVCLSMHVWVCVCVCVCVSMCVCLVYMKVKVAQLCLTLGDPMDYTVQGILQARILEWVAMPSPRGSSQLRNWTQVSALQADSLPAEPQGKPKNTIPSPADLPDPGIESGSPALQVDSLSTELWGKPSSNKWWMPLLVLMMK